MLKYPLTKTLLHFYCSMQSVFLFISTSRILLSSIPPFSHSNVSSQRWGIALDGLMQTISPRSAPPPHAACTLSA